VKGKGQGVSEWIGNVGGKDKVGGEKRTKWPLDFCLGLVLRVHGVNGGERSQEGVEVGPADGQGWSGSHLISPTNDFRLFKQGTEHVLIRNDDA
jgi:hypothetical protein